jgi:hypothetical protein
MPNRPTADRFRTVPERSPEFAHLSVDELRAYRATLTTEEGRVSYWRRIIQARLDLMGAADSIENPVVDNLRSVFSEQRYRSGRTAILSIQPVDDMPPLPDLADLWACEPRPDDPSHNARLAHGLTTAEAQLSAYRTALHRRLAAATSELIARYREEPLQCMSALPSPGSRATATGR